ncbi:MAG: hypothetical protein HY718_21210 [Planctomycetes bacterium]|nr:hypothetical protein [Planctomycetota bacterium]
MSGRATLGPDRPIPGLPPGLSARVSGRTMLGDGVRLIDVGVRDEDESDGVRKTGPAESRRIDGDAVEREPGLRELTPEESPRDERLSSSSNDGERVTVGLRPTSEPRSGREVSMRGIEADESDGCRSEPPHGLRLTEGEREPEDPNQLDPPSRLLDRSGIEIEGPLTDRGELVERDPRSGVRLDGGEADDGTRISGPRDDGAREIDHEGLSDVRGLDTRGADEFERLNGLGLPMDGLDRIGEGLERLIDGLNDRLGEGLEPRLTDGLNDRLGEGLEPRLIDGLNDRLGEGLEPRLIDGLNDRLGDREDPPPNDRLGATDRLDEGPPPDDRETDALRPQVQAGSISAITAVARPRVFTAGWYDNIKQPRSRRQPTAGEATRQSRSDS